MYDKKNEEMENKQEYGFTLVSKEEKDMESMTEQNRAIQNMEMENTEVSSTAENTIIETEHITTETEHTTTEEEYTEQNTIIENTQTTQTENMTKDTDAQQYNPYDMQEILSQEIKTPLQEQENLEKNSNMYSFNSQDIRIENIDLTNLNSSKIPNKEKKKRSYKFLKKGAAIVASAAVFGLVAGTCFQAVRANSSNDRSVQLEVIDENGSVITEGISTKNNDSDTALLQTNTSSITTSDISDVVENVEPAIVAINSTVTQKGYDFFGREYNQSASGSGSGIIIGQSDTEILIVTNNHVISGATDVEIVFADGSTAKATIKGTEPSSDLAVVSVLLKDLSKDTLNSIKIATLGDSDSVKVGHMAIAIGNALGYGQSTTVGWISALDREVEVDGITLKLIQTDAAINPGNSGGALLNAKGEVIGINSVKYADTDVEGIGYAIPISDAIPIINDLMNREELDESQIGYLGIEGKNITESFAESFNTPVGAYIFKVQKDSPAEQAGLHQGDIIIGIKGRSISSMEELGRILSYTKAGTTVELNVMVLENGSYIEKVINVTLGTRPSGK